MYKVKTLFNYRNFSSQIITFKNKHYDLKTKFTSTY